MPYPAKISRDTIIAQARAMIEADGVDKLSVNALATALGVKTPSLYRHFPEPHPEDNKLGLKTLILQAINQDTETRMYAELYAMFETPASDEDRIVAIAHAYRNFGRNNPVTYGLLYTNTINELRTDQDEAVQRVLRLQNLIGQISGEEDSLPAIRGMWALTHGFVMLELAGQFRRSGDLTEAFEKAIRAYINGWE